mmetsp:Transcript_63199/g.105144  ORF Transcript_63199/g.105144 Transcript_63199/m.105144 type:complete len:610 (-) Transcript_63199:232-2061(-)|eukprot:CAMPEP_0119321406 /NCGR_PEP_ID=MMETSP1333-20130426/55276_1 /TAXON_ID=418940 /ORGANISM="Scyphosphaera apsteinii, Strain RCC1455" /LENGTH=609 /DNA_ID=CAMNT_0007328373 /DNA_START=197 /DNA_END=2026 /DNA_ORIENTATION=-
MHAFAETCLRIAVLLAITVSALIVTVRWVLIAANVNAVYDFIVVGGGSTGSVVAGRLGQAGFSVLVLEAGGPTQRSLGGSLKVAGPWTIFDVPLGWVQILSDHRYNKEFQWDVPADPPPAIARGLGGCGIHNAMLYMRGRPTDFVKWGAGWSWQDVLPYYLSAEDNVDFRNSSMHGINGPVQVQFGKKDKISDAFVKSCVRAGLDFIQDFNGEKRNGAGFYQFMIRDGLRDSAAAAFLGEERRPKSVQIITHAHVTRLFFDSTRRVSEVEYIRGRAPIGLAARLRVGVRHEVVMCAGAIMSPKLLQLSGIGDAHELRSLGIPSVHHNPNVGLGLADGVYAIMQWATVNGDFVRCRLDKNETFAASRTRPSQAFCIEQHLRFLEGQRVQSVFGSPGMSAGAFLRSPFARSDEPDVQLTVHPWDKYSRTWRTRFDSIISMEIANNHPRSRGRVALRSTKPTDPPLFEGPYLLDLNDSLPLRWAMREVRKIATQLPLRDYIVTELLPGPQVNSEGELFDAIACGPRQFRSLGRPACDRSELPVNHLAGTCRLGEPDDPHAVVDLRLRVLGVHGVRVADASVMPEPPSGNTHATCMMIGERAAAFLIEEYRAT